MGWRMNRRKFQKHVYLDISEMNNAAEKMKRLGMKKYADLARLAVAKLDVDLQEENQNLQDRIKTLVENHDTVRWERDKARSEGGLYAHHAEYWENYGTRLIDEKDELQEQVEQYKTNYNNSLRDWETYFKFCVEKLGLDPGENHSLVDIEKVIIELNQDLAHTKNVLIERNKAMKDLEASQVEKQNMYEVANKSLLEIEQKYKNTLNAYDEFVRTCATKLGVPNTTEDVIDALVELQVLCTALTESEEGRKQFVEMYTVQLEEVRSLRHQLHEAMNRMSVWRFLKYMFWNRKDKLVKKAFKEQVENDMQEGEYHGK